MAAPGKQYLLSIDNGTQSIRAMVFDQHGELLAKSKVDIEPYDSSAPGLAEQDAQYFWEHLCQACQSLWPLLDFPREQISAVSVTTQRATVVPLDAAGKALHPAIIWLDQRRVNSRPRLKSLYQLAIRAIGASGAVAEFHANAEANWFAEERPEIWRQVEKYLLLSGYHTFRLTGAYTDAVAGQVGYIPLDFKRQCWASAHDWKWQVLPVVRDMLPELRPAGESLGLISEAASRETGIPAGIPLIASGSDKACEVLGSGCIEPGQGCIGYGTTATLNTNSRRYIEPIPLVPPYPLSLIHI